MKNENQKYGKLNIYTNLRRFLHFFGFHGRKSKICMHFPSFLHFSVLQIQFFHSKTFENSCTYWVFQFSSFRFQVMTTQKCCKAHIQAFPSTPPGARKFHQMSKFNIRTNLRSFFTFLVFCRGFHGVLGFACICCLQHFWS